jgi:hypothetical protein
MAEEQFSHFSLNGKTLFHLVEPLAVWCAGRRIWSKL